MDRLTNKKGLLKGNGCCYGWMSYDCSGDGRERLKDALEKLAAFEDLQDMIGVPLETLAQICREQIPEECHYPEKAITLTDESVDEWNQYKSAKEQGKLFILSCKKGDTVYTPCAWGIESDVVGSVEYINGEVYIKNYYGGIIGAASNVFLTEDEAIRKYEELYGDN